MLARLDRSLNSLQRCCALYFVLSFGTNYTNNEQYIVVNGTLRIPITKNTDCVTAPCAEGGTKNSGRTWRFFFFVFMKLNINTSCGITPDGVIDDFTSLKLSNNVKQTRIGYLIYPCSKCNSIACTYFGRSQVNGANVARAQNIILYNIMMINKSGPKY